jgi:glycosyltransferase involved in cell wall biosynthesis
VLLFFGFVRPYKGLENLLYAGRTLKDKGYSFKLYVVGEFWEEVAKYRRIVDTLDLEDCVLLQDEYIPNELLNQYFSAADIFIAPYQGGTQSGVVKTAIAYDLPIVGSDFLIPASSDFYKPDKHFHIHTLSPEEIANTIEIAFQDDVISKPRILPEWQHTGWDQLVDAIARLCDVHRDAIAGDDAR